MKKLILILLCLPLLFTTCKKEEEEHTPPFVKVYGCTDNDAENFNPSANVFNNTCCYFVGCYGCTDPSATNYSQFATEDDGSCNYTTAASWNCDPSAGCYDPGTGNGQYSSLSDCQNACGSASGYEMTVTVTEGNYPEEIAWDIYDPSGSGTLITEGGAPFSGVICIPSANLGSLEFRMYDSAFDGWDGSQYTLSTFNGTIAAGTLDNGEYGVANFNFTAGEACNK